MAEVVISAIYSPDAENYAIAVFPQTSQPLDSPISLKNKFTPLGRQCLAVKRGGGKQENEVIKQLLKWRRVAGLPMKYSGKWLVVHLQFEFTIAGKTFSN